MPLGKSIFEPYPEVVTNINSRGALPASADGPQRCHPCGERQGHSRANRNIWTSGGQIVRLPFRWLDCRI